MESKTKNTKTRQQIEAMAARAFGGMTLADGEDAVREQKNNAVGCTRCTSPW